MSITWGCEVPSRLMPPNPDVTRASWRFVFAGVLVLAMVAATQMPAGLGILAPFIRDDLGISRTQIGLLITTATFGAALISPWAGTLTDRLGGRRALVLLLVSAGIGFAGLALAPSYWWMPIPVVVATLAQAGGNPTTNKLIATHTPPGRRGIVTGVKQSGVQAGIFVAGVTLPVVAAAIGWRWAFGVVVIVPVVGLLGAYGWLPADRPVSAGNPRGKAVPSGSLPAAIVFLMVYGGLMGFGAAYTFLIPLFAEEALGMSEQAGGVAAGLVGLVSLVARIAWSRHADIRGRHYATLAMMAVGSVGAALVFLLAQEAASWLLWVGAIATGLTSSSWNSVGMLAVIDHAGAEMSGRASGVVMLGFLTGLGVAPTLFGWLIDRTDSYTPMWLTSAGVLGMAAVLSLWWLRRPQRPQ